MGIALLAIAAGCSSPPDQTPASPPLAIDVPANGAWVATGDVDVAIAFDLTGDSRVTELQARGRVLSALLASMAARSADDGRGPLQISLLSFGTGVTVESTFGDDPAELETLAAELPTRSPEGSATLDAAVVAALDALEGDGARARAAPTIILLSDDTSELNQTTEARREALGAELVLLGDAFSVGRTDQIRARVEERLVLGAPRLEVEVRAAPGQDVVRIRLVATDPRGNVLERRTETSTSMRASLPLRALRDTSRIDLLATAEGAGGNLLHAAAQIQMAPTDRSPQIHDVTPSVAAPGDHVVVTGRYFSPLPDGNRVLLGGGRVVETEQNSRTRIRFVVPEGAQSEALIVRSEGMSSEPWPFEIAEAPDPPLPQDGDGDGVEDDVDQCPDTQREADGEFHVDARGCSLCVARCGGFCAACVDGAACGVDADCLSRVCDRQQCGVPTCDDRVHNGQEGDVDCGGPCEACADGRGCSAGSDCRSGVCVSGRCAAGTCFDGVLNQDETAADCGGGCDSCPDESRCGVGADCQSTICLRERCAPSHCIDGAAGEGETDRDCGARCPPCADGARCVEADDCLSGVCDSDDGECLVPTCDDGRRNGDEVDVDCGGDACAPCANHLSCVRNADCASGLCGERGCIPATCGDLAPGPDESDRDCGGPCDACSDGRRCGQAEDCGGGNCQRGLCVPSLCVDGQRGELESDLDCGGPDCAPCVAGLACAFDTDCASAVCTDGRCAAPACGDGVHNGLESDVDCGAECGVGCADALRCGVGADCMSGVCVEERCAAPACADGVLNGEESDVDCGGAACGPCGSLSACREAADCVEGVCTGGVCLEAACSDGVLNGAETALDCGGDCTPCGEGAACVVGADCSEGVCRDGICASAACDDGVLNGEESDLDCGGVCAPCPVPSRCLEPADCAEGVCGGGRCAAAGCSDGVTNGDETGLDCGGVCGPCPAGQGCRVADDCVHGVCADGLCAEADCRDQVLNGLETDVDCGGGCALCDLGQRCEVGDDCVTGRCAEGICRLPRCFNGVLDEVEADVDCGGPCLACEAGSDCKEGEDCDSGVCAAESCQAPACDDGVLNGEEADVDCGGADCDPCEVGLACEAPSDCASGVCTDELCQAPACDDRVFNGAESDIDCGGDACEPCSPGFACGDDTDCVSARCEDGLCRPARCDDGRLNQDEADIDCGGALCDRCEIGAGCGIASDCASAVCVDGACAAPTCDDGVVNGQEGDVDCGGKCPVCADGQGCFEGGDCSSGVCFGGGAEAGTCQVPACDDFVHNGDESDLDCGGACESCGSGRGCGVAGDCTSGVCTDGVCVAPACDDGVRNAFETDVDCGGFACGPCADALRCEIAQDCESGVCTDELCQAPGCGDGVHNGDESDVDCGGGSCLPCAAGARCEAAEGCLSGVCDGICRAPTCDDGVRNGLESDVDCGGDSCASCSAGERCGLSGDCDTGVCADELCQASACDDGVRNGDESDLDCGGPTCSGCPLDASCVVDSDCGDGLKCAEGACIVDTCANATVDGSETDVDCGGDCSPCGLERGCDSGEDCEEGYCVEGLCRIASTCRALAESNRAAVDRDYLLQPDPLGDPVRVWCDMRSDGGGWTRVAASAGEPLDDAAGEWHPGLAAGQVDAPATSVWSGLRAAAGLAPVDLRFVCRRNAADAEPAVDLSFYGVDWYRRMTAGSDADSCFGVPGEGGSLLPARRNNLNGELRGVGSPWRGGTLRGEGSCDAADDFTVDFEDVGLDGDELDGTDWGEDDGFAKCGDSYSPEGAWAIYLRESPLRCDDGVRNGDEELIDCGGRCLPCGADRCDVDGDCESGVCVDRVCAEPTCNDLVQNGSETDLDCGGETCGPCPDLLRCVLDEDCASLACVGNRCVSAGCGDGILNSDETDVDCGGSCGACELAAICRLDEDCLSGACFGGTCVVEPCENGAQDIDESDVDCGGVRCGACVGGQACVEHADCESLVCEASVCRALDSCDDLLAAELPAPSGTYTLVVGTQTRRVYCDMETDGGGWTLVGASAGATLDDARVDYHAALQQPGAAVGAPGVWDGLRDRVGARADFRFSCRARAGAASMDVDLSFYGNDWYWRVTTGEDVDSCFHDDGVLRGTAPARRDNLTGRERARGQQWGFGEFEGEDSCGDPEDFTVDFDDRGIDGDEADGTDWGEDDGAAKCGEPITESEGAWYLWVRAQMPECTNGLRDGDETDIDCGGSCASCAEGLGCEETEDCAAGRCISGRCIVNPCTDGIQNEGESDVDCGGSCNPCEAGLRCNGSEDCGSSVCAAGGFCAEPTCDDGVHNGLELGVDCGSAGCAPCADGEACIEAIGCQSGVCLLGVCQVARCDDEVANGDETDRDCGASCLACVNGRRCNDGFDCQSGTCQDGLCVPPTCVDGVLGGAEADVDCGGPCTPCAFGAACFAADDCLSGRCRARRCTVPQSCADLLAAQPGLAAIEVPAVFDVQPDPLAPSVPVLCDMRTDGGGWTLVSSSSGGAVDDRAVPWSDALLTLQPGVPSAGIWDGMRPTVGGRGADLRFACSQRETDRSYSVDLSFYAVDWYLEITNGEDADSCFAPADGPAETAPARRNNLAGEDAVRARGDAWEAGRFNGEDSCDATDDFAVDFDDSGVDGDERDGTDWGEDDGQGKCGDAYPDQGAWFVWVRELLPVCDDGEGSVDETGVDCGGRCEPCPASQGCLVDADCQSGVCAASLCQAPTCDDGRRNGDESGADCGGPCAPCDEGLRCLLAGDCRSGVCSAGLCAAPSCEDTVHNGSESDVDCGGACNPCGDGLRCERGGDCQSGECASGLCRPLHCSSGSLDGDESDTDCGGALCPRCDGGASCASGGDCRSRQCESGRCRVASSCQDLLDFEPTAPSGIYPITPPGAADELDVWCDMDVDEGGWTLVAATAGAPLRDERADYHDALTGLHPQAARVGVWDGLRQLIAEDSDLRFACKSAPAEAAMTVDLSFYGVSWYRDVTAGADADTCFVEADGTGFPAVVPARRDNLSGDTRDVGAPWTVAGYMEGEDSCGDLLDFAVDFDERGIDASPENETAWGMDDGEPRCGAADASGAAWFIFVREARP